MKIEYVDHMGDDDRVVDAARASFSRSAKDYSNEKNEKLIKFLASSGHWTPFSHPQITIKEQVPIFVARQRFKHTVGFTYNEVSRRYVNGEPEFYFPNSWRKQTKERKQGSSDETINPVFSGLYTETLFDYYDNATTLYQNLIDQGVSFEQARMILPQSMYTNYYVTGSLAAWARAYNLRSKPDSQKEIQEVAKRWDEIIRPLFPVSWKELTK